MWLKQKFISPSKHWVIGLLVYLTNCWHFLQSYHTISTKQAKMNICRKKALKKKFANLFGKLVVRMISRSSIENSFSQLFDEVVYGHDAIVLHQQIWENVLEQSSSIRNTTWNVSHTVTKTPTSGNKLESFYSIHQKTLMLRKIPAHIFFPFQYI